MILPNDAPDTRSYLSRESSSECDSPIMCRNLLIQADVVRSHAQIISIIRVIIMIIFSITTISIIVINLFTVRLVNWWKYEVPSYNITLGVLTKGIKSVKWKFRLRHILSTLLSFSAVFLKSTL